MRSRNSDSAILQRRGAKKKKIEGVEISRILTEPDKEQTRDINIEVEFKVRASGAQSVAVAGSFNDWDVKKTPLAKSGDWWKATLALPRGRYEYRFVVDGKWLSDPNAKASVANVFGDTNSVLTL